MMFGIFDKHFLVSNLWILCCILFQSSFATEDPIQIPPDKKHCTCSWSEWMNTGPPNEFGQETETFSTLRNHGYKFCQNPVDIQCYGLQSEIYAAPDMDGVTCSVDIGLHCNLFCDDWQVRVACCYCPPEAVGPTFQIEAQPSKNCLAAQDTPTLTSAPTLAVVSCDANDSRQKWSWISNNQIKSEHTKQCIQTNFTSTGSLVITADCDETIAQQLWSYDKLTTSLSDSARYLDSSNGRITYMSSASHWKARVDVGVTDLTTMQGQPCENPPAAPEFGSVSCSFGSYQGSECQFSCDYGYRHPPDADYPAVCMRNEMYNATSTTCTRIVCQPEIVVPVNGRAQCSNFNFQDSNCEFSCNAGYELQPKTRQSICLETGKWENYPPPQCSKISCTQDVANDPISNGIVNCTEGNMYQSVCAYRCEQGYELIGTLARLCLDNKLWNASKPICQKVQCPVVPALPHGTTTCSDNRSYMSTCRYACNAGYIMVGSGSTTCGYNRVWGSTPPECQRIQCSALSDPEYGSVQCSDTRFYGSRCSYQCVSGYKVKGESVLTCTADGWDHGAPECTRIVCSSLEGRSYHAAQCTDQSFFDSLCTFSCDTGFQISGSRVIKCGRNGWNTSIPSCEKRKCLPKLTSPANGDVICYNGMGNDYGSMCFYSCNEGYRQTPSSTAPVACREDGTWSRKPATCRRIQCRKLTRLRKGSVQCSDGSNYRSNCTFKCSEGFNLYGSSETICGQNGWDAQVPTCGRVLCSPQLAQPANGKILCTTKGKLSCSFTCNKGFKLFGNDATQCQNDETWTNPDIPTCERIQCAEPATAPLHGSVKCTNRNLYGSACTHTCSAGFTLVGEPVRSCTERGDWDNKAPTCQRISCPAVFDGTLRNGVVQCTDASYVNSVCTFLCDNGYHLNGSPTSKCTLNGTWTARLQYCERITCSPDFSNPSNGRVKCSDLSNFGSECVFTCEDGFSRQGTSSTRCKADGWSHTRAPSCKKITCPVDDVNLEHGTQSCDRSNEYQSVCEYKCNHGYELVGVESRQCQQTAQWTEVKPNCMKIMCPELPDVTNGQTLCTSREVGGECAFVCDNNHKLAAGESTSTKCQLDKSWTHKVLPKCELIVTTTTRAPTTTTMTTTKATTAQPSPSTPTSDSLTSASTQKPPIQIVDYTNASSNVPPPTVEQGNPPGGDSVTPAVPATTTTTDDNINATAPSAASVPVTLIAGAVAGGLVLLIAAIIVLILYRRRNKKPTKFQKQPSVNDHRYDESEFRKLLPNGSTRNKFSAIPLDRLETEFNRRHADDDKLFREEFSALPEGNGTKEFGGKIQNKDKNRYTNILPYDHSRVILPKSGPSENDYINASFVDGYKHKGKFIAAQGPKDSTIDDFWRMIWDQNVTTIIMVTNLEEGKEVKCAQYWPGSGKEVYGDLSVVFLGENRLVDYTVRKFTIQQMRGDATLSMRRNLMHYHFTSWPDFGVPKSPSGMLKFMRKIKHGSPTGYGAIVVHCSAGVGRTGTYICIDAMVDMMLRESKVDVFGFVSQMRNQRPEMVQTEQQYIFIYNAMLEHHLYGDTEVEASEVNSHIEELNQRLPGNVTGMEHEFRKLTTIRIQKEQMRAGNHPANMRKNRVVLILPYDWNRVILPIRHGLQNSDYINASYIDGYRQKDAYIATQGPLPHTVEDFWRMIWESKSASIVMLTELVEKGQAKCEQYWPTENSMVFGDLRVENCGENELEHYTTRDFVISTASDPSERTQSVKQFHYHGWPEVGPPVSGFGMIALVEQVQKQQQTSGNHPMTIHCSAGAGRTGAFCALSTALEQVKAEGVLDMFQIVKCLRMQRPHMVQNLEQYEFCYRAVLEYIDSMSEYYNFK